jgi:phage shock protein PspC (stress-responsive transcriptional regulator)
MNGRYFSIKRFIISILLVFLVVILPYILGSNVDMVFGIPLMDADSFYAEFGIMSYWFKGLYLMLIALLALIVILATVIFLVFAIYHLFNWFFPKKIETEQAEFGGVTYIPEKDNENNT